MRQRLLLVAGWVLAAVGTSVVASAAVAATGGQVTDRALRPLTAAEVAALPGGFLEVLSESLASGDSSNRDLGRSGESTTIGPSAETPAGAGGDTPTFGGSEPTPLPTVAPSDTASVEDDPSTDPDPIPPESPAVATHIEHLEAGSVSLVATEGQLRVLWATAALGWQIHVGHTEPDVLVVSFANSETLLVLTATIVDDAIVTTTERSGIGIR